MANVEKISIALPPDMAGMVREAVIRVNMRRRAK